MADETNTANNCSAAVALTVREPPPGPDLVVTATLSDAVVDPGETFSLETAAGNRGGAASSATTLRYYRSSDAGISTSDAEVGTDAVGALAAGADGAGSLTLNAPTTPGTYYYGACADAVADETNTANNCSAAVALTVREPPPGPDLVVTATLSDAVVDPGETFSLETAVRNRGGAASAATTLRYYRSSDAGISTSDAEVGTDAVGALAAGADGAGSLTLNAPTTPGTYYYGACADAVADETNTANNCSAAVALTVREPPPGPDLVVTAMLSDAVVDPGETFSLETGVRNRGGAASAATTLRYYRSSDASISTSDAEVGTDAVGALAAGADGAGSLTLNAPTTPGTYYYGACADAVADESDTSNNCSSPATLDVQRLIGPNLIITEFSQNGGVSCRPSSYQTAVRIRNDGTAHFYGFTTARYYRRTDPEDVSEEDELSNFRVGPLGTPKARADRNSGLALERGSGRCWPKPSEPKHVLPQLVPRPCPGRAEHRGQLHRSPDRGENRWLTWPPRVVSCEIVRAFEEVSISLGLSAIRSSGERRANRAGSPQSRSIAGRVYGDGRRGWRRLRAFGGGALLRRGVGAGIGGNGRGAAVGWSTRAHVRADGGGGVWDVRVVRGGGAHGSVRAVGVVGGVCGAGADREPVAAIGRGAGGGGGRRRAASGGGATDAGRGRGDGVRNGCDGVRGRVDGADGDGTGPGGLAPGADDGGWTSRRGRTRGRKVL